MTFLYPDSVLLLFCKAPIPGQVKTRLMTELTASQAAEVHIELTRLTLTTATHAKLCPVELWCSPDTSQPFFQSAAEEFGVSLKQQSTGDLGARMYNALARSLQNYSHAILMGCDCPSLTSGDIKNALQALSSTDDCVLAPTEDGGYSLIGLNEAHPELFEDIAWSTPSVITQTRGKVKQLQLRCLELPEQWDVDTTIDLIRYQNWKMRI